MTQATLVAPVSGVRDRRDHAAFYLNLSRTGGEVVPYQVGGRPAFLINWPDHAGYVLVRNQENYRNPYHPYAELAGHYTPAGAMLLRLKRQPMGSMGALEQIADELVTASTDTALELLERSTAGPVSVGLETKKMLFRVVIRLLFDIDAGHLGDAFVQAINFIEECSANHMFATVNPSPGPLERRYLDALMIQDRTGEWIARAAGMLPPGQAIPRQLTTAIVRTLLNSYNATATALTWAIYQIARSGDVLDRLYHEIDSVVGDGRPAVRDLARLSYTRMVVMETLRLYPPAWIIGRESIGLDRIGGTFIPPGAVISVSSYTMHRHARLWERPNEFIPERFAFQRSAERPPYTYFPFGGGMRRCPAGHLAIGHVQIILAVFLRLCRIEDAFREPVRPRGLITLRPDPGVWVRFTARE